MCPADILPIRSPAPDFTEQFCAALLVPDAPAPALVTGPAGKRPEKRYNVYRNNVTVGLIEALASIFPAVQRITGADFFRAMARFHIRETPPTSPLLFEYGREFPAFIGQYEYAQEMPWLGDVARVERAWLDSYHAADAPVVRPETLASVPSERLGDLKFKPHPAMRVISSNHPVVTIFALNRIPQPVGRVDDVPEDGLITRIADEVVVRRLQRGGAAFLKSLIAGGSLEIAAAVALHDNHNFDLSAMIAGMIEAGAFANIEMEISDVEHA
ncbi:HvfC/BufC N-terminal domain-containing protein [Rhizobium sp. YTU87027]|uniref:HvfC/BufC N-terminal domain-containing protein n=1 Tax=Rhizobium sp. YTU87027 TaxID=3417741 RepID=UPI003D697B09